MSFTVNVYFLVFLRYFTVLSSHLRVRVHVYGVCVVSFWVVIDDTTVDDIVLTRHYFIFYYVRSPLLKTKETLVDYNS